MEEMRSIGAPEMKVIGAPLNGSYSIPEGGIPESDLSEEVQEAIDAVSGKQDALVSGTNIKTINNESVLGSGNIAITGETYVIDNEPTAGSSNLVKSGGVAAEVVWDVTAKNDDATFASLSALLSDADLATLIPTSVRKGGMQIRFVQNSDNKYVQYLYKVTDAATAATFTNVANWEKVNLEDEVNQLADKLGGKIDYHQETPTPTITVKSYVRGSNGAIESNNFYDVVAVDLNSAKEVVFVGLKTVNAGLSGYAFYDENGDVVSSSAFEHGASSEHLKEYTIPVPNGATTFKSSRYNQFPSSDYYYILSFGNTVSNYVTELEGKIGEFDIAIPKLRSDVDSISVQSNNILDLTGTTDGKFISIYGTETDNSSYCYTKKIPVVAGQKLFFTLCTRICAYTDNTVKSGKGVNGEIPTPWTVPEGINYIRTNVLLSDKSSNNFPYISVGNPAPRTAFGTLFPSTAEEPKEGEMLPLSSNGAVPFSETKEIVDGVDIESPNVLDLTKLTQGYINSLGTIYYDASYVTSDFIPVEQGDIVYLRNCRTVCAFTEYKVAVSAKASSETSLSFTYTVPEGISFIRTYMVKTATTAAKYPYIYINRNALRISSGYYIKQERVLPKYHLFDAFAAWKNGIDFPVGFAGDSTTDGVGTTNWVENTNGHAHQDEEAGGLGKADYDCDLAYPHILQDLLRAEFGNNNPKIYNIGYSGAALDTWSEAKIWEQVFAKENNLYCNCRMVGIVFGINDRNTATTDGEFITNMQSNLVAFVEYLLSIGITPFMVTSQVVLQAGGLTQGLANLPQNYMQRICNETKKQVARMYGLEVVDMNAFTSLVLQCSNYPIGGSTADRLMDFPANLHFADKGHFLEAGYLFSKFIPYILHTEDAEVIYVGLTNRNARSNIYINNAEVTADKFKMQFNGTQSSATDTLVYDAYIMVNSQNGAYSVKYQTPVASGYIVIDGDTSNPITIDSTEKTLDPWDIGLHHVQVYTGESTTVAFKGFLLEQAQN